MNLLKIFSTRKAKSIATLIPNPNTDSLAGAFGVSDKRSKEISLIFQAIEHRAQAKIGCRLTNILLLLDEVKFKPRNENELAYALVALTQVSTKVQMRSKRMIDSLPDLGDIPNVSKLTEGTACAVAINVGRLTPEQKARMDSLLAEIKKLSQEQESKDNQNDDDDDDY